MGTKENKTWTNIVNSEKEFYELLKCPGTVVRNLIFPNDDVAWVSSKYSADNVAIEKNVNVVDAAYVTTQARLQLYECLSKLGSLCCSVIQTRSPTFRNIITPEKEKKMIIWATSRMRWLSRALDLSSKNFIGWP